MAAIAASMAFLAGAADVDGLERLHGLFVSFMSGNTTLLGIAIGRADWPRVGLIASLVLCFVSGAASGAAIDVVVRRRRPAAIAASVAAVLAVPLVLPGLTIAALTFGMGMLNAAMNRVGRASIGLTYVTGALVKFGQGVGRALCGRRDDAGGHWWQLAMWTSLLAGTIAAAVTLRFAGQALFWPLPALSAVVAVAASRLDRAA